MYLLTLFNERISFDPVYIMEKKYYSGNKINNDLAVAHPNIAGFSFTIPGRIGI